jgi:hypothetical protein
VSPEEKIFDKMKLSDAFGGKSKGEKCCGKVEIFKNAVVLGKL